MSRGRYAPSPTGELHLGNLRTAVLAWLFAHHDLFTQPDEFAQHNGGELLYRIEDLDASRVRPGLAEQQRADLESLGLTFDPPLVVQSERTAAYERALERLSERTYPCFCTRREIAEAASAPHPATGPERAGAGSGSRRYPGTCRDLTAEQRRERAERRPPAIRLRAEPEPVTVIDLLHGEVTGVADDIVLRRNDGAAAYNLAVVVDDADAGVDQVVRGDDLLDSAIDQASLARLLGLDLPTYAHVPLVLNASGHRLAKRDGAVTLSDLAAAGVGPGEVLSLLATSLDLAAPGEPVDLDLLLRRFDPVRVPRSPWVFSPQTLP